MDQALPASEARAPGFAIGDTDYRNRPAGKSPRPPGMEPTLIWICFSRHQLRIPITSERLNVQRHPEVCSDVMTLFAFIHDVAVAKRARRGTLLGGAQDDTEKFGPLKVVLGAIPALYANHEVCLKPLLGVFLS